MDLFRIRASRRVSQLSPENAGHLGRALVTLSPGFGSPKLRLRNTANHLSSGFIRSPGLRRADPNAANLADMGEMHNAMAGWIQIVRALEFA